MKNIYNNIDFNNFIKQLENALLLPLPGETAQLKMSPRYIKSFKHIENTILASVLILLYPIKNEPWTVFIKRAEYHGAHSGQISLPGGKYETSDINLEQTALRETSEELGVNRDHVRVIGKLSPLHIPVSQFNVQPFIGVSSIRPVWNPDPNEVTYLIETSIKELTNHSNIKNEIWNIHGISRDIAFYHIKNEKIWGATAMIISEFLEIINSLI